MSAGEDSELKKSRNNSIISTRSKSSTLFALPFFFAPPEIANILALVILMIIPLLLFRRKKKEEKKEEKKEFKQEEEKQDDQLQKDVQSKPLEEEKTTLPAVSSETEKSSISIPEPTIRIIKEEGPGRTEIQEFPPSSPLASIEEKGQVIQSQQLEKHGIPFHLVKKEAHDPADWILDCVGGYDFWPEEKGPLPKPELEVEFKKKFPGVTLANFNSIVYDLIYKDKIISEVVDGVTLLRLSAESKAEKAAEWNKRYAEARLLQAQLQAQKQGASIGERRKEWIELSPQAELGKGGPWDDLNRQMKDIKWYGRVMTLGPREIKSLMWHREPPIQEHQPPKAYYPNIMLEWRQSVTGQSPYWHIEGVNIKEEEFMKKIQDKTWSEWLAKNKIVIDVPTWEEAVVKVLELAKSFV